MNKMIVTALCVLLSLELSSAESKSAKNTMHRIQNHLADKLDLPKVKSSGQLGEIYEAVKKNGSATWGKSFTVVGIAAIPGKLDIKDDLSPEKLLLIVQAARVMQHFGDVCGTSAHPLVLSSAARSPEIQDGAGTNAAPSSGPLSSLHLRFAAFDFTRKNAPVQQQRCIEREARRLRSLNNGGSFEWIKEQSKQAPCFHFVVLKSITMSATQRKSQKHAAQAAHKKKPRTKRSLSVRSAIQHSFTRSGATADFATPTLL